MAALTFGNIAAGTEGFYAGMDLATKRRQTLRTEEKDVMALEALRRQEALRQQQANAPAPEAVTTGDLLGVGQQKPMDVEQVAPPAAPAPAATAPDQFSGAVSPETRQAVTQAPANISYGQMVPNPSANPRELQRATEMANLNRMRLDTINNTLKRTDIPPNARRSLEQQRDLYQQRLTLNEQVITRNQPTIDFGREGRSSVIREFTPQAVARSAVQYDAINTPYDDVMTKAAQQYGIDPVVFKRLIGTESSFKADAINNVNGKPVAFGIAQIYTTNIGTKQGQISQADAMDPLKAIPYAAQLFAQYLKEANGNYEQALYRYKGATSVAGRTAMARPIATILSGIDQPGVAPVQVAAAPGAPTAGVTPPVVGAAPAAPGAASAQPVVAGPIAAASTPGVAPQGVRQTKETKSPTSYYLANVDAITGDQKILGEQYQRTRAEGIRKFQMYQQAGMGAEAEAMRDQIVQLDQSYKNSSILLQGMNGIYQLEFGNDPRAVSAVMSYYVGQPVAFQPRSDGNYNMWVNGKKVDSVMTKDDVRVAARQMFDEKFRADNVAKEAAFNKLRTEKTFDIFVKRDQISAETIKEILVQREKGNWELKKDLANQGWEAKPNSSDGTIILIPPKWMQSQGASPYIFNPNSKETVSPDGVNIPANSAVPIRNLPSAISLAKGK
jgi:soluble lytic murein transglycosylase-like protein